MDENETKSVLVTGTSTGIGRAVALHLDSLGFEVFACARDATAGEELKSQSPRIIPLILDVTDSESIRQAMNTVATHVGTRGLFGLVNNAGVCLPAVMEHIDLAELRRQFEVNVFGQVAVTREALPLLRQGNGRIVNIGSASGYISLPFFGSYAASKFALEAITDAFRRELKPWGIPVVIVDPGPVRSAIWKKGRAYGLSLIEALPEIGRERYERYINKSLPPQERLDRIGVDPSVISKIVIRALTAKRPKARYGARIARTLALFPDWILDSLLALRKLK